MALAIPWLFIGSTASKRKVNKPIFRYQAFEKEDVEIPGTVEILEGDITIKTEFIPDATSKTGVGTLTLFVNDKPAGKGKLTMTFPRHGLEPFEVGRDSITPVFPVYAAKGKFEFSGKIEKIEFDLK